MKNSILALSLALFLAACSTLPLTRAGRDRMENPLFAQQYYAELVDHFVNLQVQSDPILLQEGIAAKVDAARRKSLERSQEAAEIVSSGSTGTFTSVREETRGTALVHEGSIFIGPDFFTTPGGELHVFVTRAVDPRDAAFPDETAADLGLLDSPYGDQSYELPESFDDIDHLTVVLYDAAIKRMHGFAQLRP